MLNDLIMGAVKLVVLNELYVWGEYVFLFFLLLSPLIMLSVCIVMLFFFLDNLNKCYYYAKRQKKGEVLSEMESRLFKVAKRKSIIFGPLFLICGAAL